jgi:hypothetical protein
MPRLPAGATPAPQTATKTVVAVPPKTAAKNFYEFTWFPVLYAASKAVVRSPTGSVRARTASVAWRTGRVRPETALVTARTDSVRPRTRSVTARTRSVSARTKPMRQRTQPVPAVVTSGILPDVEGEHPCRPERGGRILPRCQRFGGVWLAGGFFRRAGSHGSTAGRLPATTPAGCHAPRNGGLGWTNGANVV